MTWRQELDAILPRDRADSAPITEHLRGLLEALHNGQGDRPRITITLEQDAWAMLEAQFRRPYRPHSSYTVVALDVGMVAFERRKGETCADLAPDTGWVCEEHGRVAVAGCRGPWMPDPGSLPEPPKRPSTTAPTDAPWPEGPFPRRVEMQTPTGLMTILGDQQHAAGQTPIRIIGSSPTWDASAIESKATALATPADGPRSEGAIYEPTPLTSDPQEVNVPTYGGPWKEPESNGNP